ncbi:DUF5789 family protein [Halorussus caseinilyticus]|uniref:DUF2795 domain-containing protein n=1 Tax=Halorussus caseinilyticus TaxID=3034025 RepID=A0ABD5WUR3_9EURY|nr:hypothetical protein [Halorussus sp. DT72]
MTDTHREQGVEFGELAGHLDGHDYPATTRELADTFGEFEITYAGGSETLAALLAPIDDTCDSAAEVRQVVLNTVAGEAVGRKGYTDRGAFASAPNDVSF